MDIMTKVRVLWEKVTGLTTDVSAVETQAAATAATVASILPRIPADYSTTEVNTGVKWIDGKDIYMCTFSGNMGTGENNVLIPVTNSISNIVDMTGILLYGERRYCLNFNYNSSTRFLGSYDIGNSNIIVSAASAFADCDFSITLYYTKPDPVPGALDKGTGMITGEEPEPETKKRKTKKEEK